MDHKGHDHFLTNSHYTNNFEIHNKVQKKGKSLKKQAGESLGKCHSSRPVNSTSDT